MPENLPTAEAIKAAEKRVKLEMKKNTSLPTGE